MKSQTVTHRPLSISIDSRTVKKGDTFIAIKGKQFDGHAFVAQALRGGAVKAIVSEKARFQNVPEKRLLRTKDTVKALGDMARSHRAMFDIPVIAVTGTSGKTTAKDMVAEVLSARYKVLKNRTSENNLIGLPLTLLKLNSTHRAAVLEMGMNRAGEIARLSEIAGPKIGVITNIGPAHLEFLRTLENILRAKRELLEKMPSAGLIVLNRDDRYLRGLKGIRQKKAYFGIEQRCEFQARDVKERPGGWRFTVSGTDFELGVLGRHNIYNALVAVSVGRALGIDYHSIRKKIKRYRQGLSGRLCLRAVRGVRVLDDTYNSNPLSMNGAIDTLLGLKERGKKIIVSGDMLELGSSSEKMHRQLGSRIASAGVDVLITVGRFSEFTHLEAKRRRMREIFHAASHCDAADILKKTAAPGDAVLVKGSRGMEMERVIQEFRG